MEGALGHTCDLPLRGGRNEDPGLRVNLSDTGRKAKSARMCHGKRIVRLEPFGRAR